MYEGQELQDYIGRRVAEMPPQVQEQIRTNTIPFGLWDKLRARFYFAPKVLADLTRNDLSSSYVNGESHVVDFPVTEEEKAEAKAVPILYSFNYRKPNGESSRPVDVRFDYDELLQVFQQLGADKSLVYIEMNPTPPEGQSHVRVYNDKESVWLKKYKIQF